MYLKVFRRAALARMAGWATIRDTRVVIIAREMVCGLGLEKAEIMAANEAMPATSSRIKPETKSAIRLTNPVKIIIPRRPLERLKPAVKAASNG